MLNGTFSLHDVRDVEALCGRLIQQSAPNDLSHHDREDLLTYLIESCWELSRRYEQGSMRQGFSIWATVTLRRRIVDWQRSRNGRTKWAFADRVYERPIPELVSLDDREDGADHSIAMDADACGLQDLLGLQRTGSRQATGSANGNGQGPARRAA